MKVLLVDDHRLLLEGLTNLLEAHGIQVVGTAGDGHEAIIKAGSLQPDVILMDIRMPGMDGLEAARHLTALTTPPAVIFTTAYDDYALEAFDTAAVGYLLKPVRRARLTDALARAARPTRAQLSRLGAGRPRPARSHVAARVGGRLCLIPLAEIRCFCADQKYVAVHHGAGVDLIDEPLKALEEEFGRNFVRIHRGALVALAHVESVRRDDGGRLYVKLRGVDEPLAVSRRHTAGFRQRLRSG
jgi:two-component system response regulator AlgR